MENIKFRITGVEPLLLNNPQCSDPFNAYAKAKAKITNKRKNTEEELLELRRLDVVSKLYFDEHLGVYIPSTWILAALAANGWNRVRISKAQIRGGIFQTSGKIKLDYEGRNLVKTKDDIANNPKFVAVLLVKQKQGKIPKATPIFHNWHFDAELEFDPTIIDRETLIQLLEYIAVYGGFGDFRPTYGRARFEELNETD